MSYVKSDRGFKRVSVVTHERMKRVKRENTAPELIVRRILHSLGLRFRLHQRHLPGSPDIVLPRYMTAIFVHGCFWHAHANCARAKLPKNNAEVWIEKMAKNRQRDKHNIKLLEDAGWTVEIVWECQVKNLDFIRQLALRIIATQQ